MKKASIITVNFNQQQTTEALLESIISTGASYSCEILVVDNGSKFNAVPEWQVHYPDVIFIRSEHNLGFAGGNNLGIKEAKGEYLFFINNDTELTPGLIERMLKTMDERPQIGMLSPKIHYFSEPQLIQYIGFTPMNFYTGRNRCLGWKEQDSGQYDGPARPTAYIHGAAMMVRRTAIEKAGVMAENFFLYYEELDWCERIRKAGFEIWVDPGGLIFHKESISVGNSSALKEYFMNRNRILFVRKHAKPFQKVIFTIYFSFIVFPRNLFSYLSKKRTDLVPYLLKAIKWNMSHSTESKDTGYPVNTIK
ncbi:glycosyltransferase family 2 protein [Arcticibacter sp. MXS-1]|uniref:glycosyltransferase family 2 protein n=1 Tax=Arcticibacter sp. MXS-1 TaxID=3341726 RepID=UPI0035A8E3C0